MIRNKKILITGGLGFIGSHLAKELIKYSNKIYIIDNFKTRQKSKIEFINKYKKNITFIKSDVSNFKKLPYLIKNVDIIYHLAASMGVENVIKKKPTYSILNNLKSTENIFHLCAKFNKRIIFTSSSEVYGLSSKILVEDARPNLGNPKIVRWSYAYTKLTEEFLAMSYFREKNLKVTVVRLFNTVGEGQTNKNGMVISNFFSQALKDKSITVYGDGKQSRSFTYVKDTITSLIKLYKSKDSHGEIVNISSLNKITIISLAKKIIKITNSKSKIRFIKLKKIYGKGAEDGKQGMPSLKKLKMLINYIPNTKLDKILKIILNSKNL